MSSHPPASQRVVPATTLRSRVRARPSPTIAIPRTRCRKSSAVFTGTKLAADSWLKARTRSSAPSSPNAAPSDPQHVLFGVVRTAPAQRLVDPCSAIWIHRLVAELNPHDQRARVRPPGPTLCAGIIIRRDFRALLERTNPEERRATGPSWIHFRAQDVRNPLVERPFNWFKSPP